MADHTHHICFNQFTLGKAIISLRRNGLLGMKVNGKSKRTIDELYSPIEERNKRKQYRKEEKRGVNI